jgi:hypothetical protein
MRQVLTWRRRHQRRHGKETSLAVITIASGLVAFVCGLVPAGHFVAVCVGIATFLVGLYSQLVSATTAERWVNVIGIGLAFVGVGLGMSHGGFTI